MPCNSPSNLPKSRLCRFTWWLCSRTQAQAIVLVALSLAAVTVFDFSMPLLGTIPLYILPIALASWALRKRGGVAVVVGVTLLAATKEAFVAPDPEVWLLTLNAIARAVPFAILVLIVRGFRMSFDDVIYHARHDRMTGALNKEAFNNQAAQTLQLARQAQSPQLLVLLDLDGFKGVNDRHGHEAGDDVLERFAGVAAGELRATDCFGRIGGDEFALLLPVGSIDAARELAHDLHRRLSAALAATGYPVTCSMGALLVPVGDNHARRELMREADRLMYEAKQSGKNGVRFGWMVDSREFPESINAGEGSLPEVRIGAAWPLNQANEVHPF